MLRYQAVFVSSGAIVRMICLRDLVGATASLCAQLLCARVLCVWVRLLVSLADLC